MKEIIGGIQKISVDESNVMKISLEKNLLLEGDD